MYAFLRPCMMAALMLLAPAGAAHADGIDDIVKAHMARNHIPGAAVAVIRNGQVEKLQAYGVANLEHNSPVTVNSPFQIASVTKIFTGVLLAHLVEQGKLSLDDPLSRYLPDTPAEWAGMTVGHLASHTAGFRMSEPGATSETMDQAVANILKRPLATRPGEKEQYALDDFILLTYVLEKASGKTYPQLLDDVIVRPLGMTATRFENGIDRGSVNRADVIPGRVSVYSREKGQQRLFWFLYPPASYGPGGLYTSVEDLSKLMLALDRGELLGPAARAMMWTPTTLANGKRGGWAHGWTTGTVRGKPFVGHSGGPSLGDVVYVPEARVGVVVLTNQRTLYPALAQTIAAQYLPASPLLESKGIKDSDPKLSASLLGFANAIRRGEAKEEQTAGSLRGELSGYNEWMAMRLNILPAPTRMVLLKETAGQGKRTRNYRVTFGQETQEWRFDLDDAGKVTGVDITGE